MAASNLPDHMRSAQWTTVPMESSLKLNPVTPLPKTANSLPKNSALIKVSYASLNPVDYKVPEFSFARMAAMGKGPWIPASDYAGTVVTTNLAHLKPGDKVAGCTPVPKFGTLAEYIVVEGAENISKLPPGIDLRDASTLPIAAQTAMQSIAPYVQKGHNIIIYGASGGTGTFGIQIAKILGCSVTAVCSGANADFCKSQGADKVIDYKTVDVVQELKREGMVYDLIVNNVAISGDIYTMAHHYLKETGRYVTIAGGPNVSSVVGLVQIMVQPAWLGGGKRKAGVVGRKADSEELVRLAGWVRDGKLKPVIEKVYGLDEVAEAFKRMKSSRTRGKLVVTVSED